MLKSITSLLFLIFFFGSLDAQYISKRELYSKNHVLEFRYFSLDLLNNKKELQSIHYLNDSGLIVKEVYFS